MKNLLSLAILTLFTFAFSPSPVLENLAVDTNQSIINWKGYKVLGQHEGTLKIKNGQLDFDNEKLTGGSFEIDMQSITVTDLKGGGKTKLEGHLKSADFFGVDKFPTAKFKITRVVSRGKTGDYKIIGDLTIKKTTKQIKFNAKVNQQNGLKVATAKITLDRTEFDVRYGSGSFFDSLGDNTIYDEFDLDVKLVVK